MMDLTMSDDSDVDDMDASDDGMRDSGRVSRAAAIERMASNCTCGECRVLAGSDNPFALLFECPGPQRRVRFASDDSTEVIDFDPQLSELARLPSWEEAARDRMRFHRRIDEAKAILTPSFARKDLVHRAYAATRIQAWFRGCSVRCNFGLKYVNRMHEQEPPARKAALPAGPAGRDCDSSKTKGRGRHERQRGRDAKMAMAFA